MSKRKQIRLKNYDYSQNGYYFIRICTYNRQQILSEICDGIHKMPCRVGVLLRPIGKIAENEINELTKRYPIEIDSYVIMPDHIHLLLKINRKRAEQSPAPTVPDIICTFKSLTTKNANKNDNCVGRKIWQRSYYEHIIHNEEDYAATVEYILNNPSKHKNGIG